MNLKLFERKLEFWKLFENWSFEDWNFRKLDSKEIGALKIIEKTGVLKIEFKNWNFEN